MKVCKDLVHSIDGEENEDGGDTVPTDPELAFVTPSFVDFHTGDWKGGD
jgi:hypothetical protein